MRTHRLRLSAGASLATIAALFGSSEARAQAFQGTPTTTLGNVSYNRTTPGVETITIDSAQATINWAPSDTAIGGGDIVFLPSGNAATYAAGTGAPGGAYTVLNRIIPVDPSRRILLDGQVTSAAGGKLWFYAPGGLLIGANARFNIGGLLLTAGDPKTNVAGQFLTGGNFGVAAAVGSTADVSIATGAQINAVNADSYVVAVAPRIADTGTINVNGSAALVAGEVVDFTYNAGLFDITVTQGTTVNNPLFHNGATGGPAAAAGEFHRVYMVAVPKNTAITSFITAGGNIGFAVAGAANLDGNTIVLSAGYNILGVTSGNPVNGNAASPVPENLSVEAGSFTSNVKAAASGDLFVASTTGNTSFASDLNIKGVTNAHVNARNNTVISIAGNATISASVFTNGTAGANRTAGTALLNADTGGSVSIGGDAVVTAVGVGDTNTSGAGSTGTGTGGVAAISISGGGNLTITGNLFADASGFSGTAGVPGGDGGDGVAGSGYVSALGAGLLSIGGSVTANATGAGGDNRGGGDLTAGMGKGGMFDVSSDQGGRLRITGAVSVNIGGFGGNALEGTTGGVGLGGTRGSVSAGQNATTTVGGDVSIFAHGAGGAATFNGAGGRGGAATGGTALLNTYNSGGLVTIAGNVDLQGFSFGGAADTVSGIGGAATGGTVQVTASNGTIRTTGPSTGGFRPQANAIGGDGATGGAATGGTVRLSAASGAIVTAYKTDIFANGSGAAGVNGNGGAATGGAVDMTTSGTAPSIAISGDVGFGAIGTAGNATGATGTGGAGTGGAADISVNSGAITLGGVFAANAAAGGGNGVVGGNATAGTVDFLVQQGALTVAGNSFFIASATGGNARALNGGAGGSATAGGALLNALSGASASTIALQNTQLIVTAAGGAGGSGASGGQAGGRGGDATGGSTQFIAQSRNGQITGTVVSGDGTATGGAGGAGGAGATGGVGGRGGDAIGGFVINFGTSSGSVAPVLAGYNRTGSITLTASATGGVGGAGGSGAAIGGVGGRGGDATAGNAGLLARGSEVTTGAANVTANSTGGNGGAGSGGARDGDGGNALAGGAAGILATPQFNNGAPATVSLASITATNFATGGSSGTGVAGSATAGEAYVRLEQTQAPGPQVPNTGTLNITGAANLTSSATGGNTGTGTAGAGTGGLAHFVSVAGTMTLSNAANAAASGTGGTIVSGGVGGAGTGGTAEIFVDGGGRMDVTNRFNGFSTGTGSNGLTGTGGAGRGGIVNAQVATGGGTLNLNAGTQLLAQGVGGSGAAGGGAGTGGNAFAGIGGAGNFFDAAGTIIQVQGFGGASSGALGGAATGGVGNAGSNAGAARFNASVSIFAAGTGGSSSVGTGGAATGGQANIRSNSGSTIVTGAITASTSSSGGASSAGNGGAGTGGSSTVGTTQSAGTFTANGSVTAVASGVAGAGGGAGSTGGGGTGGLAQLLGYGPATFNSAVQLGASGSGGTGAAGGAGTGGNARVVAVESATAGGSLAITFVTGAASLAAQGTGGAGLAGFGGAGGKGTGGSSYIGVTSTAFNSQLTGSAATQNVNGVGGAGGSGTAGQAGGRGGDGVGGTASSGSTSSGGTVNLGGLIQTANGSGGVGGAGGNGAAGGRGGDGTGGATGSGNNASGASALTGSFTYAAVTGNTTGFGGAGGAGGSGAIGGAGGFGTGGNTTAGINGGVMTITGLTQLSANGRGGAGGAGATQGAGGNGAGGNAGAGVGVHFVAGGTSDLNGGSLNAFANGIAGTGSTQGLSYTGRAVVVASFGNARFADIYEQATGANPSIVPSQFGFIASGIGAFNGTVTTTGYAYLGNDINNTTPTGFGSDGAVATDNGAINIGGDLILATSRNIVASLTGTQGTVPGTVTTGGGAVFDAGGSITMTSKVIAHGSDADFNAGTTITLGDVRSDQDVTINGDGNIVTGNLSAGDSIQIDSQQSRQFTDPLSTFTVTTGNLDAGTVTPSANANAGYQVGITGNAGVTTGTIAAINNVGLAAFGGSVTTGAITTTRTIGILAANAVTTGALTSGTTANDYVFVSNPSVFTTDPNLDASGPPSGFDFSPFVVLDPQPVAGNITINGGVTTGRFKVATAAALNVSGAINATTQLFAQAQSFGLGDVTSGGGIDLTAATTLTAGNVRGELDVKLSANGDIVLGNVSAGDSIQINPAAGQTPSTTATVRAGNLDAGLLRPSSDPQAGYQIGVRAPGNIALGSIGARGNVGLLSDRGSVTAGAVTTQRSLLVLASNGATTGAITTAATGTAYFGNPNAFTTQQLAALVPLGPPAGFDFTPLFAVSPSPTGGPIAIGGAVSTGRFTAASAGLLSINGALTATTSVLARARGMTLGNVTSGPVLDLESTAGIAAGNVRGEDDVFIDGAGNIQLGTVSAADTIFILSNANGTGGTVTTGALDAGILRPSTDPTARYGIAVDATGGATIGSMTARGAAGVVSRGGAIGTGAIDVGLSTALLGGGNVTASSIKTGASGTTLIAADSMASLIVSTPTGLDYSALIAATPVRLNGAINVTGAVDTGSFKAASSGAFGAAALKAAQAINVNSGALASFSGLADSPTIAVRSGDIAIGQTGALGTSSTNLIDLQIDSAATAISIGGASAQGWSLDTTEAGRLHARRTLIQTLSTQPPMVRIGALTLTGSAGTNPNLIGQTASFEVQTSRSISVTGAVSVANAAASDTLKLTAGQRLDVLTDMGGALSLTGTGETVSGTLDLTARDLFVGTSSLAGQLTENASFAGRDAALAAMPTTPNLAGYIGANTIRMTSGGTVLIQNTGDRNQRAGFTAGPGGVYVTAQSTTQQTGATPVDVVINGRVFDSAGTAFVNQHTIEKVTFVPSTSGTGFTATSSVNGCVIDGVCRIGGYYGTDQEDPVLSAVQDIATDAEEITDEEKRKIEAAEQAAAEEVPQVRIEKLISSRNLIANPVVEEPITSGGNPSLWTGAAEPLTPGPGETP